MKRFYREVAVTAELGIALDGRPMRTPARAMLAVPTMALAEAIAAEWAGQGETVEPRSMQLTGLANAAIDRAAPDPASFARPLAAYAESDALLYRAADPADLAQRQVALWNPILDWAERRYGVEFALVTGIMHRPQPPETIARLSEALAAFDRFRLAGLHPLVTVSGSLVVALAIAEGELTPDEAWAASELDELWQAETWGEDTLAIQARAARRADFDAGARFLALLA